MTPLPAPTQLVVSAVKPVQSSKLLPPPVPRVMVKVR
jgi:hypothetical protein